MKGAPDSWEPQVEMERTFINKPRPCPSVDLVGIEEGWFGFLLFLGFCGNIFYFCILQLLNYFT